MFLVFCVQAEDGIRDLVRSRGLGDVYKRQVPFPLPTPLILRTVSEWWEEKVWMQENTLTRKEIILKTCLLYTSDAADERSSVDLGGRRLIKKNNTKKKKQTKTQ